MSRYKAYSAYRDSQSKWPGVIPDHWNLFDGKRLFSSRRELAREGDEQLAASQKYGVVPQSLMMEMNDAKVMLALKGTSSFRHVGENDFVISLRSFEGGIEHSSYVGCVSPAYTVLQAEKKVVPAYFKYLLKSGPYIAALQASTDSLRDGKSISYEQFGAIPLPYPVVDEQAAIAAFLDHETAKIDALIEKQQRLIELLKEKRQAVISHAVTKGLNPNAPMKDSGVEWLGEVPAHWAITQPRYVCFFVGGGTPSKDNPDFWDGDIPWVSPKDMKVDFISDTQDHISTAAVKNSTVKLIGSGAVLMVVRGMILDHSVPVAVSKVDLTVNQDMKALIPRDGLNEEYFLYCLRGLKDSILDLVESSAHGTKCLRTEQFDRMEIPLPSLPEQLEIVNRLKTKLCQIDDLALNAESLIKLSQERRTALISAAVTGKIDVRDWQAAAAREAVGVEC